MPPCHYCNVQLVDGIDGNSRPTLPVGGYECRECHVPVTQVCRDCAWWLFGPRYSAANVDPALLNPEDEAPLDEPVRPCPDRQEARENGKEELIDALKNVCGLTKHQCKKENLETEMSAAWKFWDESFGFNRSDDYARMAYTLIAVYLGAEKRCNGHSGGYFHLFDAPKIARKHLETCFTGGGKTFIPAGRDERAQASLHYIELLDRLFRDKITLSHAYRLSMLFIETASNNLDRKKLLKAAEMACEIFISCCGSAEPIDFGNINFKPLGAPGYITADDIKNIVKVDSKAMSDRALSKISSLLTTLEKINPANLPKRPHYVSLQAQANDKQALEALDLEDNQVDYFQSLPKMDSIGQDATTLTECERNVRERVSRKMYALLSNAFSLPVFGNQPTNKSVAPNIYAMFHNSINARPGIYYSDATVDTLVGAYLGFPVAIVPNEEADGLVNAFASIAAFTLHVRARALKLINLFHVYNDIHDSMTAAYDSPIKSAFEESAQLNATLDVCARATTTIVSLIEHINGAYTNNGLRRYLVSQADSIDHLATALNDGPGKIRARNYFIDLLLCDLNGPASWLETTFGEGTFDFFRNAPETFACRNDYWIHNSKVSWRKVFRKCSVIPKSNTDGFWTTRMSQKSIEAHEDDRKNSSGWYWDWRVEKDRAIYSGKVDTVGPLLGYRLNENPRTMSPVLTSLTPYIHCPIPNANYGQNTFVWNNSIKSRAVYTLNDRMPPRRSLLLLVQDIVFMTKAKMGDPAIPSQRQAGLTYYTAHLEAHYLHAQGLYHSENRPNEAFPVADVPANEDGSLRLEFLSKDELLLRISPRLEKMKKCFEMAAITRASSSDAVTVMFGESERIEATQTLCAQGDSTIDTLLAHINNRYTNAGLRRYIISRIDHTAHLEKVVSIGFLALDPKNILQTGWTNKIDQSETFDGQKPSFGAATLNGLGNPLIECHVFGDLKVADHSLGAILSVAGDDISTKKTQRVRQLKTKTDTMGILLHTTRLKDLMSQHRPDGFMGNAWLGAERDVAEPAIGDLTVNPPLVPVV
ncbi:MAG: hypothetical protein OCD01_10275 [Fibrobacterales bacterium]